MTDLLTRVGRAVGDRYEVEREIGRGGMATVYLAKDLRHHRPVAVKVLRPELTASLGAERFLREIAIAARLQHPHIVPLYDSGQADDLLYYVMPYVQGESLRQRLQRERQLPLEDALGIARTVASALAYAHRQHVVHRDIKPENIMLHDGEAVVTDFGIAKAVTAAAADTLTQTGSVIGTPAYMSPEQAAGEADLDARSDIYSLGTVVYEMIAGTVPFTGPTTQALIARLFTQPAEPLGAHRGDVPELVEQAVARALAKAPEDRFESATRFAQALSDVGAAARQAPSTASIAVLPFANMSADPDNDYLTDGIAEEIITALTKVAALRVASRMSAFAFKGKNADVGEVGRKLRVGTVLAGSVRRSGDRLRVTAQLANTKDGYQLWSERYDRRVEDVFTIQDDIAESIVRALRVVLSDDERPTIDRQPTDNLEAYEYYLRGRQYFHQFRRTGMQFARRMFERAAEIDPGYARAHCGIADCCAFIYSYWDGSRANLTAADAASLRAVRLAPELAQAHASRGFTLSLLLRHDEARREFEEAIRLDPRLYEAHYFYARACVHEGRLEEAVREFGEAARVRPEDYQALLLMAAPLTTLGRLAEAKEVQRRGLQVTERHLELNPDDARALYLGAGALVQLGERERAAEWARRAYELDPDDPGVLYNLACTYSTAGMLDDALRCLEGAIANGFGHREWVAHDGDLDPLRGDPRFQALLQKM